jgi:hypothetical protein
LVEVFTEVLVEVLVCMVSLEESGDIKIMCIHPCSFSLFS